MLRLAICNELFERFPFHQACKRIRALGYQGLEIAPFTLSEDPANLPPQRRNELRRIMEGEGLEFVGLHWLLASPPGLHVTTRDVAVRRRSWDYLHQLIDLCADLADSKEAPENAAGVMVFGSPLQRSAVDGMTPHDATSLFTQELAHLAPHAASSGVEVLIEALPLNQSNVINSLDEAVGIVREIGSPAIQTMFDSHNAVDEKEEHASLIRKYRAFIHHVHLNEIDGREPGMGNYNFQSVLTALSETNYPGWVSLEAFDFSRDPEDVARRARLHLEAAHTAALSPIL